MVGESGLSDVAAGRKGRLRRRWPLAFVVSIGLAAGCAVHKQVQYFAATDPETGFTNYYKMTVTGSGGFGTDYHLQAGYFSAAAVDMLRGSMPDVPELDLPIEQLEVFDRLTAQFYSALIQEAKRVHNVSDPEAILIAAESSRNHVASRTGRTQVKVDPAARRLKQAEGDLEQAEGDKSTKKKIYDDITAKVETARGELKNERDGVAVNQSKLWGAERTARDATEARIAAGDAVLARIAKLEEAKAALGTATEGNRAAAEADVAKKKKNLDAANGVFDAAKSEETRTAKELSDKQEELELSKVRARNAETRLQDEESDQREANNNLLDAERRVVYTERIKERAEQKHNSLKVDLARQEAALTASNRILTLLQNKMELDPFSSLADPEKVEPFKDDEVIELARVVWYGSLSSSDLASIGMTGNTSPYQFRKLVFWATATNIDLNEFATEIDSVLDNSLAIASAAKAQAKQRKAEKKSRRESMDNLLDVLPLQGSQAETVRGFMDLLNPPPPEKESDLAGDVTP